MLSSGGGDLEIGGALAGSPWGSRSFPGTAGLLPGGNRRGRAGAPRRLPDQSRLAGR